MTRPVPPPPRAARRVAPPPGGLTRAGLLRAGALVGGAAVGGAAVITGLPEVATSAPSAAQDTRVLNFVLELERLEEAFYTEAERTGVLTGDLAEYVRVVRRHEGQHVALLERTLGDRAEAPRRFDLAATVADERAFTRAARTLEDNVVAAYNGQVANLTKEALAAAARIASVESRHAAWIRAIAGEAPAPDPTDDARTEEQVRRSLADAGLLGTP